MIESTHQQADNMSTTAMSKRTNALTTHHKKANEEILDMKTLSISLIDKTRSVKK